MGDAEQDKAKRSWRDGAGRGRTGRSGAAWRWAGKCVRTLVRSPILRPGQVACLQCIIYRRLATPLPSVLLRRSSETQWPGLGIFDFCALGFFFFGAEFETHPPGVFRRPPPGTTHRGTPLEVRLLRMVFLVARSSSSLVLHPRNRSKPEQRLQTIACPSRNTTRPILVTPSACFQTTPGLFRTLTPVSV